MTLPLRDFTDMEWVYEQYRQDRETDFLIAELKGWRVGIHSFEGVEQPVAYNGEITFALPHYYSDANDAMALFNEIENGHIFSRHPSNAYLNQFRLKFTCNGDTRNVHGHTFSETVCIAWLLQQDILRNS